MTQDQVFLEDEGNQWFWRNEPALTDEERLAHDPVLRLVDMANLRPENILEVGASNGYRLHALHERFNCRVTAIEPSHEAIQNGRKRYPAVEFLHGVAANIPIEVDGQFDLVIVNFVFHWVDRRTLLRSLAEIDRMSQDGGHVIIGDFAVPQNLLSPLRVSQAKGQSSPVWAFRGRSGAF